MKILEINRLDAHDRLGHFKQEQASSIEGTIRHFLKQDPFCGRRFYLFAHPRTGEERGVTRMLWQPRLTKPVAQTNSMLFKVDPKNPEEVNIIWMIPDKYKWHLYTKGSLFEHEPVINSIHAFTKERERLEAPEADDPTDEECASIYASLYPNLVKAE